MRFKTGELVVIDEDPKSSSFVETFIYEASDKLEESLGNLYIVGQVYSSLKKKDNAALLVQMSEIIKNEYYRNPDRESLSSFKSSLKRINGFLENNKDNFAKDSFKINMTVIALTGRDFFTAQIGEGVIMLLREGKLNKILVPQTYKNRGNESRGFINVVEGSFKEDDTVIITTPQIYKVGQSNIIKLFQNKILEGFINKNKKDFSNLGLITISRKKGILKAKKKRRIWKKKKGKKLTPDASKIEEVFRAILVLLVILSVGAITISAIATKKELGLKKRQAEEIIKEIEILQNNALSLTELENYQEAEESFKRWEENIEALKSLGVLKEEVKELEEKLNDAEPIVKRYQEIEVKTLFSLANNSLGFSPEKFSLGEKNFYLFKENQIYIFNLESKTGGFTTLPKEKVHIKSMAINLKRDSIFILNKNGSILDYRINGQSGGSDLEFLILDEQLKDVMEIDFYNETIYALAEDKILYLEKDRDYKEFDLWSDRNFSKARSFAIDTFIYVLEEGKINKLLSGERNISIETDKNSSYITTNPNSNNLYLLNPKEGVVTIRNKFGDVIKRIQNDKFKEIDQIKIGKEETLFFLKENEVFYVKL